MKRDTKKKTPDLPMTTKETLECLDVVRKQIGEFHGVTKFFGKEMLSGRIPWDKSHGVRLEAIAATLLLVGDLIYDITNRVRDELEL